MKQDKNAVLQRVALFIVLLFHVSGVIGILYSDKREWFIQNTPLNLLLMAGLLILTQREKNGAFFLFFGLSYLMGFGAELMGVNTGLLFGQYEYGTVLGTKWYGVPLLIGINWFIIMYCAGIISSEIYEWANPKVADLQLTETKHRLLLISFVIDGALLATLFDFLIEPAAVKMGFWQWLEGGEIPAYNYVCWFGVSAVLLTLFKRLPCPKRNPLAVHLFLIQVLFFLLLRMFL